MILTEIGEAVASVADSVGPSVVGLGGRWGMGSGVLLEDGLVLTNAHNVSPETGDCHVLRPAGGTGERPGDRCGR